MPLTRAEDPGTRVKDAVTETGVPEGVGLDGDVIAVDWNEGGEVGSVGEGRALEKIEDLAWGL
jgi:hypothetical protein